jgi:hypothetical protein
MSTIDSSDTKSVPTDSDSDSDSSQFQPIPIPILISSNRFQESELTEIGIDASLEISVVFNVMLQTPLLLRKIR